MTSLAINLSDELAKASQEAARKLGMSRSSFIRLAIVHEIQKLQAEYEQEAIAKTLIAMEKNTAYAAETKEIENYLNAPLPEEQEEWWKKK